MRFAVVFILFILQSQTFICSPGYNYNYWTQCEVTIDFCEGSDLLIRYCDVCYIPPKIRWDAGSRPDLTVFRSFQAIHSHNNQSTWAEEGPKVAASEDAILDGQVLPSLTTGLLLIIRKEKDTREILELGNRTAFWFPNLPIFVVNLANPILTNYNQYFIVHKDENFCPFVPKTYTVFLQAVVLDTVLQTRQFIPKIAVYIIMAFVHAITLAMAFLIRSKDSHEILYISNATRKSVKHKRKEIWSRGKLPIPVFVIDIYWVAAFVGFFVSIDLLINYLRFKPMRVGVYTIYILRSMSIFGYMSVRIINSRRCGRVFAGQKRKYKPLFAYFLGILIGAFFSILIVVFKGSFRIGFQIVWLIISACLVLGGTLLVNFSSLFVMILFMVAIEAWKIFIVNFKIQSSIYFTSATMRMRTGFLADLHPFHCQYSALMQNGSQTNTLEQTFTEPVITPFIFIFIWANYDYVCPQMLYTVVAQYAMNFDQFFAMFVLIYNSEHSKKPSKFCTLGTIFISIAFTCVESVLFKITRGGSFFIHFFALLLWVVIIAAKRKELKQLFFGFPLPNYSDISQSIVSSGLSTTLTLNCDRSFAVRVSRRGQEIRVAPLHATYDQDYMEWRLRRRKELARRHQLSRLLRQKRPRSCPPDIDERERGSPRKPILVRSERYQSGKKPINKAELSHLTFF